MKADKLFEIVCPDEYQNVVIEIENIPNIEKLNGRSPMVFSVLGDAERKLYEESEDKHNFIGTSESIKIFNIEIEEYYSLLKDIDSSGVHDLVMKKLKKYCNVVPTSYAYITHILLHELGHYQQYVDRGRNVYEYISWCEREERENFRKQQELSAEIQGRVDKLIKPFGPNKGERIKLEKLAKEYRNIPKEKEADDFAYANMRKAIEKISDYLKANK